MRAMILAAGLGTRLRPITEKIPKPLILINNKPLIFYSLSLLKKAGIKEVIINVHYLAEKIMKEFGSGEKFGMNISYSFEKELLGSGGGIKKCEDFFKGETFIVMNSDILINIDLEEAIDFHKSKNAVATMVLKKADNKKFTSIKIDGNYKIKKIGDYIDLYDYTCGTAEKYFFTGIHILENHVFEFLKENFSSINETAYPQMIKKDLGVYGYRYNGYWADLGTVEDYEREKRLFAKGVIDLK